MVPQELVGNSYLPKKKVLAYCIPFDIFVGQAAVGEGDRHRVGSNLLRTWRFCHHFPRE